MTLLISFWEYHRITVADRKRWTDVEFTRGGDWRQSPHTYDSDSLEQAEQYGVAVTTVVRGRP